MAGDRKKITRADIIAVAKRKKLGIKNRGKA